ncbi:MAG: nicotinate-nucleotide adenylyltransferase [Ignavibacteria bacterium]|nr:nicotinate-nucleotide adenylyltransferase [Ignavibacteria bacterium]
MKIGLYGGTFDPIHFGHLITATYVKEIRRLDKIIFMPCYISPLRQQELRSSSVDRYNMVKASISETPYFSVSDLEINRAEISYTIDTIKELKKTYNEIELIIGYDNLLVFDKWKDPDEIFKLVDVVVLNRKVEIESIRNIYFSKAIFINTPLIEISASQIRNRVANNLNIDFLVPQIVKEYIYKNKLYN